MSPITHMTSDEFEAQKHKLRTLSVQTNELARLILVERLNNSAAASAAGMSRQNVSKHMTRVLALLADMPKDHVYFEGWMSNKLAAETREKIRLENETFAVENSKKNM
ncbi:TrfB-related DNA-binding protein [Serratia proteamaculans]|uniref:TrfB-related DNA-binding protein n=1 Tax=Serratia proteamaculans TaxID=28151 RepID=UPI003D079DE0